MGLPKRDRLTRRADYEAVRLRGKSFAGRLLVVGFLEDSALEGFRAGFVVSKSVGGAVQRNATKRRLREIVRHHSTQIRPGFWIVTIARHSSSRAPFQAIQREWLHLIKKAGLIARQSPPSLPAASAQS